MPKITKEDTGKKEKNENKTITKTAKKGMKEDNGKTSTKSSKTLPKSSSKKSSNTIKKKTSVAPKKASPRKKTSANKTSNTVLEYYDLPYRYNQTVVKILAQTPKMLFVYWDIADEVRSQFTNQYGADFFSKTHPVLVVHNITMKYTFEVEINDFANSWYLQVNDSDCQYTIELGRRPNLYQDTITEEYILITSSNSLDTPNDHILIEKFKPQVTYRNVKTQDSYVKDFNTIAGYENMKKIYGIYDLYQEIYKNELFDEITHGNVLNPSSLSSSQHKK